MTQIPPCFIFSTAAAVSSTGMSRASVSARPYSVETSSPSIHKIRSMPCTPWFISAPPPSCSQVPRQPRAVVIGLVTIIFQVRSGQADPALNLPSATALLHSDGHRHHAPLEDALHLRVGALHHADHIRDLLRRDLHRLFAHNGLTGFGGGFAHLAVGAAGYADAYDVHGRVRQNVVIIIVDVGHAVFWRHKRRPFPG